MWFSGFMHEKSPTYASLSWADVDLIGFDTETTGKYPLSAEVCELAAVKWRGGRIVDAFQTLLKPSKPMDAEVIAIHGITNEMLENAPEMGAKIGEFREFIRDGIVVAHHAPFDLGFMSLEFEKHGIELPLEPALCSSLLARKLFPESDNHRLQTLVGFFDLEKGQAHRALDDARACLEVTLRCLRKTGEGATLVEAFVSQGGALQWQRFSIHELEAMSPFARVLTQAIREERIVEMSYGAGSTPGEKRRVHPLGLVRSLDGDYVVAYVEKTQRTKRYLLEKIGSPVIV
jgi:DNA polymerase-3 subunit epsilon